MKELELTRDEEKEVEAAMATVLGPPPVEKPNPHTEQMRDMKKRGEAALKQAERAAHRNNIAEAKRWTDLAQKMAATARQLAEIAGPDEIENEEEVRAELRARIAKFVEQDNGRQRWQMRYEIWCEMCVIADQTGAPMPPPMPERPPHWSDALSDDLRARVMHDSLPLEGRGQGAG